MLHFDTNNLSDVSKWGVRLVFPNSLRYRYRSFPLNPAYISDLLKTSYLTYLMRVPQIVV